MLQRAAVADGRMLPAVGLDPVMDQLGKLNREIIDKCFLLRVEIDHFRAPTASVTGANLCQELEVIRKMVNSLCDEIAQESKAVLQILADTAE
jgi:hypothetical protein